MKTALIIYSLALFYVLWQLWEAEKRLTRQFEDLHDDLKGQLREITGLIATQPNHKKQLDRIENRLNLGGTPNSEVHSHN